MLFFEPTAREKNKKILSCHRIRFRLVSPTAVGSSYPRAYISFTKQILFSTLAPQKQRYGTSMINNIDTQGNDYFSC